MGRVALHSVPVFGFLQSVACLPPDAPYHSSLESTQRYLKPMAASDLTREDERAVCGNVCRINWVLVPRSATDSREIAHRHIFSDVDDVILLDCRRR